MQSLVHSKVLVLQIHFLGLHYLNCLSVHWLNCLNLNKHDSSCASFYENSIRNVWTLYEWFQWLFFLKRKYTWFNSGHTFYNDDCTKNFYGRNFNRFEVYLEFWVTSVFMVTVCSCTSVQRIFNVLAYVREYYQKTSQPDCFPSHILRCIWGSTDEFWTWLTRRFGTAWTRSILSIII